MITEILALESLDQGTGVNAVSFRTRLESYVESRRKIQIWYGMGCHNTVTGRVLAVDHDHIEVEAYSHESDGQISVRQILVPLHLILHIDITRAETEESENRPVVLDKQLKRNERQAPPPTTHG